MKWFKVQHRCPDTKRKVLIWIMEHGIEVASYKDNNWQIDGFNPRWISHWAELPHGPRGER